MLLRRITQHVKDQNWFAVALDFIIVVAGVVIGIQVANWNDNRAARAETDRTLEILVPNIEDFERQAEPFKAYYSVTKAYGETALSGWANDEAVSDSAFLIAAYQASQIMGSTAEAGIYADLIGAENIRNIPDLELQRRLQIYFGAPSNLTRREDVDTPYRQNVRRVIPFEIQEKIRAECGDQRDDHMYMLPIECEIDVSAELARAAAAELRTRTDLRDDLQWHMASTQAVLFDLENELERNEALIAAIKDYLQ